MLRPNQTENALEQTNLSLSNSLRLAGWAALLPLLVAGCATSSQSTGSRTPQRVVDQPAPTAAVAPLAAGLPRTTNSVAARLPLKMAPRATRAEITEQDLMTRLYQFADDSMLGRGAGELGNYKATDYIAREAARLGLVPAGEQGYFQEVPLVKRGLMDGALLAVNGQPVAFGEHVAAITYPNLPGVSFGREITGESIAVIYGGTPGRIGITAEQARGKLVILSPWVAPNGMPTSLFWQQQGGFQVDYSALESAAGIAFVVLDLLPPNVLPIIAGTSTTLDTGDEAEEASGLPLAILLSAAAARQLLDADYGTLQPGAAGRTVSANIRVGDSPVDYAARNVIAKLEGSDPALRGQYVVIGAHSDHVGMDSAAVEHDSLRAYNQVYRPGGADAMLDQPQSAARDAQVRSILDSLRALRPARMDSIYNGADDDGSGSVALLEIAEAMARADVAPRRSMLFVWHTAEELGLFGAQWYADFPTVPRDSIVTMLNIDMIGRGGPDDLEDGRPDYLTLIGSRRLSTQLGNLVEQVNRSENYGLFFDYQYDADGHPLQYYCRSDHYEYAKYGIPVTFFNTGGHRDYHQLTDEPQYVNYPKLTVITRFIHDVAAAVANLDQRPVVDGVVQDPAAGCRQ